MKNRIDQVDVSFDGGLFALFEFVRQDSVREYRVTEPDRVVRLMDMLHVFDKSVLTVGASICVCLHCHPVEKWWVSTVLIILEERVR